MKIEQIQKDKRGEVWKIDSDKEEYILSKTLKGQARGGDIHGNRQYTLALEGKFQVRLLYPKGEEVLQMGKNDLLVIPPEVPHVFICEETGVLLEWHGSPKDTKKRYFQPYRKLCK